MADQKVEYLIEILKRGAGATEAVDDLGKVDKKSKDVSKSLSDLGRDAKTAFAAIGGIAFLKSSLNAFIESERAIAKLNQALINTGKFSKDTSEDLQALAKAMSELSTHSDEDILDVFSKILHAGAAAKDVGRITQAVLDLSTVMGKDLPRATLAMVNALQGKGVDGFQGIAVSFKEGATEAQKFNEVLKTIEKTAGGQAGAAMDGVSGRMERMKKAFEDAQENIGKWVAWVVDGIGKISDKIADKVHGVGPGDNTDNAAIQNDKRRAQLEKQLAELTSGNKSMETAAAIKRIELERAFQAKAVTGPATGVGFGGMTVGQKTFFERDTEAERAALDSLADFINPRKRRNDPASSENGNVTTPGLESADKEAADKAFMDMFEDEWKAADDFQKKRLKDEADLTKAAMARHEENKKINEAERGLQNELIEAQLTGFEKVLFEAEKDHEERIRMIQELEFEDEDRYNKLIELENARHEKTVENIEKEKEKKEQAESVAGQIQAAGQEILDRSIKLAASGIAEATLQVAEGSKTAKEAFSDFARTFLREIAKMILQTTILIALKAALKGVGINVAGSGGQFTKAASGGVFPRLTPMAAGGMALAGGVPGVHEVNSPTVFDKFNVMAGEAGREVLTVLRDPRMVKYGDIMAQVGSIGNHRLALIDASALDRMAVNHARKFASGGMAGAIPSIVGGHNMTRETGPNGELYIRIELAPGLKEEITRNSVSQAKVEVAQDMQRDTPISAATKRLVS